MRAASKTRSGRTPRLSPRRKRRLSLPALEARPSVSASASRSKSWRLTNVSLSNLSAEAVVRDAVVIAHVEIAHNAVAVAMVHSVVAVVTVLVVVADVATVLKEEAHVAAQEVAKPLPSTPTTRMLSQAWEHKSSKAIC